MSTEQKKVTPAQQRENLEKIRQVQSRILSVLRQNPMGATDEDLEKSFKDVPVEVRRDALNGLLKANRLQVLRGPNNKPMFKEISPELAQKFQDLANEDMLVYNIIEQAGNTGIWKKDITIRSKLQSKIVEKCLKTLKAKKLVKTIKHVHGKNKQIYMLEHLEPSREITGGVWYKDAEYNLALIQVLQEEAYSFIVNKKYASTAEVLEHIRTKGVSDVDLREDDMQSVMNALMYDGLIEEILDTGTLHATKEIVFYKPSGSIMQGNPFSEIPCATCPVFNQCTDNGDINPKTCIYLKKWMELDF